MTDFDYRHLVDLNDDIVLLEWDMAICYDRLEEFMRRCAAEPDQMRAAPYLLYESSAHPSFVSPHWAQFVVDTNSRRLRPVARGEPICNRTGFGLTYLPGAMIAQFAAVLKRHPRHKFTDMTFSYWHDRQRHFGPIPIEWDCEVVHLHYRSGDPATTQTDRNSPDRLPEVPDVARNCDRPVSSAAG